MLQIRDLHSYDEKNIDNLYELVKPILLKRKKLHEKYSRNANDKTIMFSNDDCSTKLTYEKFITDLATGYTSGKPIYSINTSCDDVAEKIENKIFGSVKRDEEYIKGMQVVIKHITTYNDDEQENYDLIHDIYELTSCYEIIYETKDEASGKNEIIYTRFDPLQTVATWDYSCPANLTGLIRVWDEIDINENKITKIELTDKFSTRIYNLDSKEKLATLDREEMHKWNDVPAIVVETNYSIFEPCEDMIRAYEQLIQNVRNTYQYNDSDCKLKIVGYSPDEPSIITDEDGNAIENPARKKEDEAWIKAQTIYVGENGDVDWLSKPMNATDIEKTAKMYENIAFQLSGIPNTSDLSFNSNDLNTSAIDRKFYIMNMATKVACSLLKKAYLRRWELIFNRINVKNSTNYDFRDILVDIPKNLPANDDELITSMLKLRNVISDQTIVSKLGYDYNVEKQFIDEETEDKIITNIENMQMMKNSGMGNEQIQYNSLFNHYDTSQKGEEVDDKMGQTGQNPQIDLQGN